MCLQDSHSYVPSVRREAIRGPTGPDAISPCLAKLFLELFPSEICMRPDIGKNEVTI